MRYLTVDSNQGTLGFQIAPMIDVVFVIMLFFMVMAGAVKVEKELNTSLPSSVETTDGDTPDEEIISISNDGVIALNDEPMGAANDRDLASLCGMLARLKQDSEKARTTFIVTIVSDPLARYSRVVDVLNALSAVRIPNITFTVSEEE